MATNRDDLIACVEDLAPCCEWLARCFAKVYPSSESQEVQARVNRHLDLIRARLAKESK